MSPPRAAEAELQGGAERVFVRHRHGGAASARGRAPALAHAARPPQSRDTEEITDFLNKSVVDGCEGLMVKTMEVNATYEPSKRSLNWLKVPAAAAAARGCPRAPHALPGRS